MNWKEMLEPYVDEEHKDSNHYMAIAEMAEKDGCCHAAGVLRDIAHEEQTHQKLIAELVAEQE